MRVGQSRKRDANESGVVKALRKVGVSVAHLSEKGIADLLCYHQTTGYFLLEVKTRSGKLTAAQKDNRGAFPFHIARTEEEALWLFAALLKHPNLVPSSPSFDRYVNRVVSGQIAG